MASIPDCVLGGMTTFLFANVIVSGITVLSKVPMTRRNRFILALSLGIGVAIAPSPDLLCGSTVVSAAGHSIPFGASRGGRRYLHAIHAPDGEAAPFFSRPPPRPTPASRQPKQNRRCRR